MAKFKHIRVIGATGVTFSKRQPSFESMQIEQKNKEDEVLKLFLFKPRQTGYSAIAEMTAAAINNPNSTAIAAIPSTDENVDDQIDRESLLEVLRAESNVPIFEDEESLSEYVDDVVEDIQSDAISIVK